MQSDEEQIRQLVATWMQATKAGDSETVLSLIADDAVFLVAGQVMTKKDFAAAAQAQSSENAPQIDGRNDIQEIKVLGEWAFMWAKLTVVVTPRGAGKEITRAGHTLSILKKESGKWLLARDSNTLVVVT